jgi:pyrroloquinoline quinone (PQQ) biosynthesis protein C
MKASTSEALKTYDRRRRAGFVVNVKTLPPPDANECGGLNKNSILIYVGHPERDFMNSELNRVVPLQAVASYPEWLQTIVKNCDAAKHCVVRHELFKEMKDATLTPQATRRFLLGGWQTVEQFPQFMALNLTKVRYGRSLGEDKARRYLIRNIRVEQNHADYWVEWAAASGISVAELTQEAGSPASHALSHWCGHTCARDMLAPAMAATNYAVEGATGEWAVYVCSTDTYEKNFDEQTRKSAMHWLKVHAHYDDAHPWEALDIIATLLGNEPSQQEIDLIEAGIRKSYECITLMLDHCMS